MLEGLHAVKHALRFGAQIETAWTNDREAVLRLAEALTPDTVARLDDLLETLPDHVYQALAPNVPETGVIALARRPRIDLAELIAAERPAPAIWLEDPAHLGNVGAVVRVAAAAGAAAVLTSGRHDPWDPAALRGSAGLHFALPVLRLDTLPDRAGPLIAIDPDGDPLRPEELPTTAILAFGSERRGLSDDLLARAERRLSLPMMPHVSSLNLATSVAAVLYAWRLGLSDG